MIKIQGEKMIKIIGILLAVVVVTFCLVTGIYFVSYATEALTNTAEILANRGVIPAEFK